MFSCHRTGELPLTPIRTDLIVCGWLGVKRGEPPAGLSPLVVHAAVRLPIMGFRLVRSFS